ncbi:PD-(D/E)XK nuclease family protein [Pontibacter russatus]|uniref:PD-(D/E)XK nuclease family protein n=1 Tax=Pontibacter russatus TaxID=2694929 RepID=UPI00137B90A8|nr:PD-(D/E)XK nuclease family protein [Pontibacter russatus]
MRYLSLKQEKFRDFLFLKLGFKEGEHLNRYREYLEALIDLKDYKKEFTFTDRNNKDKQITIEVDFTIVDWLVDELNFREGRSWKKKATINIAKATSATDLANFSFCPASFSISNTFETERTKNMEEGTLQHEKFHLLKWKEKIEILDLDKTEITDREVSFIDKETKDFFKELKYSKVVYSGHQENGTSFFFNKAKTFVGQPDYVFKNSNGNNFIVEEKLKFNKEETIFFVNNKVQLAAYLIELEEFNANYGYLVYWYYYSNSLKCKVVKITKNEVVGNFINNIFKQIDLLKEGTVIEFDTSKLNINKCLNCSVRKWCGHKSGNYNDLSFPYSDSYMKLFYVKYEK